MRHPHYENGVFVGHYANEQKDRDGKVYTSPPVQDDHPDILAWNEYRKSIRLVGKSLEQRVIELEAIVAQSRKL